MREVIQKRLLIPAELDAQRLDSALAILLPEYSRSQLSLWIKNSLILKNQKHCKPRDPVKSGDIIDIDVDLLQIDTCFTLSEPEAIPLHILYEDEALLIINKPAGLVVHPGAGNKEHTLVNALLHHAPDLKHLPRAGIVHRLDKDTSGLLVIAKTLSTHTALIRLMQDRQIERHYLALVHGRLIAEGRIATCFGRHPKNRLKMAVTKQGREAITFYRVKKNYDHHTLLEVRLETGRTHQIRVHLAHLKHPVVGDPLYGGLQKPLRTLDSSLNDLLCAFKRQALHAYSLSFTHPLTSKPLTFTAPLPDDFSSLLTALDNPS
jgi:23S rRNA pseudouridine1911/1915/1917 synthase